MRNCGFFIDLDTTSGVPRIIKSKELKEHMSFSQLAEETFANQGKPMEVCYNCGRKSFHLLSCGRCKKTKYCDKNCQRSHWSQHKTSCQVEPQNVAGTTDKKTTASPASGLDDLC